MTARVCIKFLRSSSVDASAARCDESPGALPPEFERSRAARVADNSASICCWRSYISSRILCMSYAREGAYTGSLAADAFTSESGVRLLESMVLIEPNVTGEQRIH